MGELRVSADAVAGTALSVEESAADLRRDFDDICAAVEALVGAGWSGQAADGFRGDWAQWREGFEDVMAGLHREANALSVAAEQYSSTDDAGASALASQMGM